MRPLRRHGFSVLDVKNKFGLVFGSLGRSRAPGQLLSCCLPFECGAVFEFASIFDIDLTAGDVSVAEVVPDGE